MFTMNGRMLRDLTIISAPVFVIALLAAINAESDARVWIIVAGILAVVLTAVTAWFVTVRSGGTLQQPIAATKKLLSGDLTGDVEINGTGELQELMKTIKALSQRMTQLISDVRTRSTTVAATSSQISRDNETLRVRSEMQVESLQQTTSAMNELNDIVQRNADKTQQADDLVALSAKSATDGGNAMTRAVRTMQSLRDSSAKIVDIIALIDSIAFQTNILALNAAVEAARAGEHGRGFAVVAGEVGTLAKRSAAAAKEIKSLINTSVKEIGDGAKFVDEAGATMSSIVTSIQSLTEIIQSIRNSSDEQRGGIDLVNGKVTEVLRINKSNVRMAAEIIEAAGVLNEQSVTLRKSIEGYDIGIREHGTPDEAHDMVKRAVEFLQAYGRDEFLAEVNKMSAGRFIERDLYLVACDVNTYKFVASGVNSRVINYDSRLTKDPDGRAYMMEMIDLAKRDGEGWIEYKNNHPVTNELMNKRSFVQRVGDLAIACGAYT